MRYLLQASRRWHLFFQPHSRPFQNRFLHASYHRKLPNRISRQGDADFTVREFEQAGAKGARQEIDPNDDAKAAERYLRSRIDKLDKELEKLKEDPLGLENDVLKALFSDNGAAASKDVKETKKEQSLGLEDLFDDAEMEKMLQKTGIGEEDQFEEDHMESLDPLVETDEALPDDKMPSLGNKEKLEMLEKIEQDLELKQPSVQEIRFRLPEEVQVYLDRLNKALKDFAEDDEDIAKATNLWQWYSRCKASLPGFTSQIPESAWEAIFRSQTIGENRLEHLRSISEDIISSGKGLDNQKMLVYVYSLHMTGDTDLAVSRWQAARHEVLADHTAAPDFWRLGVELYTASGQLTEAEDLAFEAIDPNDASSYRILTPVISGWASTGNRVHLQKAWTCYLKMRAGMGKQITEDDYETVSTGLLKSQRPDLALAVFKDMLVARDKLEQDSTRLYQQAMGYVGGLQQASVTEEQVNQISIGALTFLPRRLQNKFFYGKWIKKLIGLGEVDAAGAVIELMYERSVQPDARHVNGIIGALFRDGKAESVERAESMAWAMIKKRIEFVEQRKLASHEAKRESTLQTPKGVSVPLFIQRIVPRANVETFSILLLRYFEEGQDGYAAYLTDQLARAEIATNTFIVNQWLLRSLRKHKPEVVWKMYLDNKPIAFPDLNTFVCLWNAGKTVYDRPKATKSADFPSARLLFHEFQAWFSRLDPRVQRATLKDFSPDLYDEIVRCFCLSSDLKGTLVALQGLREHFGLYPDESTGRMIVIQVSRMIPTVQKARRRATRGMVAFSSRGQLQKATQIATAIAQARAAVLIEKGHNRPLEGEDAARMHFDNLCELCIQILQQMNPEDEGTVQINVNQVADVMGVSHIDTSTFTRSERVLEESGTYEAGD